MMVEQHLKDLEKQVDSKYTLVTLAAKRARELTDGDPSLVGEVGTENPVSIALYEIAAEQVGFERTKDGVK